MSVSPDQLLSVFVTVRDVFPDARDDYESIKALLTGIDRNTALTACSQINLELSDPMTDDEERRLSPKERLFRRQQILVPFFFTQAETQRLSQLAARRGGTEPPIIFFREQILELIRWIALGCEDQAEGEVRDVDRRELTQCFIKALLIAGSLWSHRVYRNDLAEALGKSRDATLTTAIRAFRNAATFRLDPITAISRGCRLMHLMCALDHTFEEELQRKTNLTLQDYLLVIFVILSFTLGHHSQADSPVLVDLQPVRAQTPNIEPALTRFLSLASLTPAGLRDELWKGKSEPTADDLAFYDLRPLMQKPVLLFPGDKIAVLDAAARLFKRAVAVRQRISVTWLSSGSSTSAPPRTLMGSRNLTRGCFRPAPVQ
jgi:hypothetical protein